MPGWHKDGWHFRHFLDSPEQGLLGVPLMTNVLPEGGGTFIAADSVPVVARHLAAHPEGVMPDAFPWQEMVSECRDFREITGEAGDFFLRIRTCSTRSRRTVSAARAPSAMYCTS